jgi:very-short-patch-repair endonuclease
MYRGFTEAAVRRITARRIAAETGLSDQTIRRARTATKVAVDRKPLIGLDGIVGNPAERTLAYQLAADGIRAKQNYRFSPPRKLEIDVAIPEFKIGAEVDGGVYDRRAHGSIEGILRGMEKHNLLTIQGWRVLRFTPDQVKRGDAVQGIKDLLSTNG